MRVHATFGHPSVHAQNHIFRNAMFEKFPEGSVAADHRIWIGVKTDPFSGKFVTQAGIELDGRIADWAPGEPAAGDCVVADRFSSLYRVFHQL